MNRDELERLNKQELVEAYLALQAKLQRPRKRSRTSLKPPSTDHKEKRASSKPGGAKPGHEGCFCALAEQPDRIIEHRPARCPGCGHGFAPDALGAVIGAQVVRDIAYALEVSDDPAPLRLKLWMGEVFALWRGLDSFATSTIARKRRSLEDRIGEILCARSGCDVTSALLRKIANARDQLLIFLDAPDLVQPTNNDCERALRPAVINRKVTNGFRSTWAAHADAAMRTVIGTERLTGLSPYHAIRNTIAA